MCGGAGRCGQRAEIGPQAFPWGLRWAAVPSSADQKPGAPLPAQARTSGQPRAAIFPPVPPVPDTTGSPAGRSGYRARPGPGQNLRRPASPMPLAHGPLGARDVNAQEVRAPAFIDAGRRQAIARGRVRPRRQGVGAELRQSSTPIPSLPVAAFDAVSARDLAARPRRPVAPCACVFRPCGPEEPVHGRHHRPSGSTWNIGRTVDPLFRGRPLPRRVASRRPDSAAGDAAPAGPCPLDMPRRRRSVIR